MIDFAHLHLLLNHFPIIGSIIGLAIFLFSFVEKNEDVRRVSLIIFAVMALLTLPTFFSGVGARAMIIREPGVSDALITRHEGSAILSLWFMVVTGALSVIGLWQYYISSRLARWNVTALLLLSFLTVGLMVRTGNTGGEIRHPEIRGYQGTVVKEGVVGSVVHAFEPAPAKFTHLMIANKYWWAFMMDLHFIGLALIIGIVGIIDMRIMGFFRVLPVAPLHAFLPWAMIGLGINVVTGLLAFIGMPSYYTFDIAFWIKMTALMLLGLNVVIFYLPSIFGRVEQLGPGQDAPMSAKFVAVTSLILWFAVITFGRYIQAYMDTIFSNGTNIEF